MLCQLDNWWLNGRFIEMLMVLDFGVIGFLGVDVWLERILV